MEELLKLKPELLAPAGNREAFEAAIAAGADAVYLGAGEFNARRNADNFEPEDLRAACRDAHLRGRKVYLTANTLVMPGEMETALATVADAAESGIDAAIVQDVGLMSVLRRELPELELHTSTQMNIRGPRGIEIARKLGATRVTLARELSIEQIAELAELGLDLEVFVHGALCICQSGQCLFSSLIGGRSANRGLCAQPCRLPYKLVNADGKQLANTGSYLLSPRDLCGIDVLDRLVAAGVASLKIEGRMKSAEYVSTVVSVYRQALDEVCADRYNDTGAGANVGAHFSELAQAAAASREQKLAEAFSRGFTTAYLTGERGNEMMGYKRPNNRGVSAGRVSGFANGRVKMTASVELERGDLLEVWTKKGRVTHTIDEGDALRDGSADLRIREAVSKGDRIFRVRSARLAREAQERTELGMKIPVAMDVRMRIGEPLLITVRSIDSDAQASAEGPVIEAARTKAIGEAEVIEHVGRFGGTPYVCEQWNIALDDGVGIGFSTLHKVRKKALESFGDKLVASSETATARAVGERDKRSLLDFRSVIDISEMSPFATIVDFEDTDIACTLEQFERGCAIGPKLYATNIEAIQTWAALGATFVWLSPELTLHQMKLLADDSPLPLGLIVSGSQELMVSDHCFLMAEGPCDQQCARCERRGGEQRYLQDRKGYKFPVTTDIYGRGHLYNAVPLDVTHAIGDLLNAGVRGFAVDATLLPAGQAEAQLNRVRSGLKGSKVEKHPDTTTGHLFRPVE